MVETFIFLLLPFKMFFFFFPDTTQMHLFVLRVHTESRVHTYTHVGKDKLCFCVS